MGQRTLVCQITCRRAQEEQRPPWAAAAAPGATAALFAGPDGAQPDKVQHADTQPAEPALMPTHDLPLVLDPNRLPCALVAPPPMLASPCCCTCGVHCLYFFTLLTCVDPGAGGKRQLIQGPVWSSRPVAAAASGACRRCRPHAAGRRAKQRRKSGACACLHRRAGQDVRHLLACMHTHNPIRSHLISLPYDGAGHNMHGMETWNGPAFKQTRAEPGPGPALASTGASRVTCEPDGTSSGLM